jgi:hypothetical protein
MHRLGSFRVISLEKNLIGCKDRKIDCAGDVAEDRHTGRVGIDRQRCLESFGKGLDRSSLGWAVAGPSQTRRVGVGSTECRPDGQ